MAKKKFTRLYEPCSNYWQEVELDLSVWEKLQSVGFEKITTPNGFQKGTFVPKYNAEKKTLRVDATTWDMLGYILGFIDGFKANNWKDLPEK